MDLTIKHRDFTNSLWIWVWNAIYNLYNIYTVCKKKWWQCESIGKIMIHESIHEWMVGDPIFRQTQKYLKHQHSHDNQKNPERAECTCTWARSKSRWNGSEVYFVPGAGIPLWGHHQKPQFDPIPRYPKPSVPKIPESWTIAFPGTQSTSLAGRLRNRYPVWNILQWETNYTASKFHGFSSFSFIFPIEIAIWLCSFLSKPISFVHWLCP